MINDAAARNDGASFLVTGTFLRLGQPFFNALEPIGVKANHHEIAEASLSAPSHGSLEFAIGQDILELARKAMLKATTDGLDGQDSRMRNERIQVGKFGASSQLSIAQVTGFLAEPQLL